MAGAFGLDRAMRFPPSILEEIRARLPVSSVVGRRVKLIKAGREFKGLSPFNAEKSPSFFVNDQKGFYHDFSSGKHGDIFSFLIETEGLSFPEAVERLAAEAGVVLPKLSEEAVEQETRAKGLVDVMGLAQQFFAEQLRGRAGAKARAYLEGRSLSPQIWDAFGLGYAPDERFALRDYIGHLVSPLQTAAVLFCLAFGMIARWRAGMYREYQALMRHGTDSRRS